MQLVGEFTVQNDASCLDLLSPCEYCSKFWYCTRELILMAYLSSYIWLTPISKK